jgi:predicted enzyme related to lactoylglutathione lyase
MSVLGLSHFMILANDMKATLHFYNKVMGLPVLHIRGTEEDPQGLQFKEIEISKRSLLGEREKRVIPVPAEDTASLYHIAFYVDNIEEIVEQMTKRGAKFFVPITTNRDGSKWAMCRDPDGNRIEVTTAPHF